MLNRLSDKSSQCGAASREVTMKLRIGLKWEPGLPMGRFVAKLGMIDAFQLLRFNLVIYDYKSQYRDICVNS